MPDEISTVVYTATELSDAVGAGSVYDYVYLGDHIQIPAGGITIDPAKTSLVIDGLHGGNYYSLEDANLLTELATIGIRSASNITVTFKNMVIIGRNYYGVPFVSETADTSGVTVVYDNVIYTGPQITYNPNGITRYKNCDITIAYPEDSNRVEEVGEVSRVEFDGSVVIEHTGTGDGAFWFRGTIGAAYLKVLQGASVSINTVNYFMFSRTPVVPLWQNPVAYELEPGSSLTLTTRRGISYASDHRASSLLVDTGASFRYVQQQANGAAASLYINGALTVNEDAHVYMQADYSGARPLISFAEGSAQIGIINPKSFVLYNRASAVLTSGTGVTRPFRIEGGQLNQWDDVTAFPNAGDMDDEPDYKWNRPSWESFAVYGSVSPSSTSVAGTTFTPAELNGLPDPDDFSFQNSRMLSIGYLTVSPDLVADDGRPVSGQTDPGADVLITFSIEGDDYSYRMMADPGGSFLASTPTIPAGTMVAIKVNIPFLITSLEIPASAVADQIVIQKAPERISFRIPPFTADSQIFLSRVNPTEAVEILDRRSVLTDWELLASVSGPLQTEDGEVLGNAVVFRDSGGTVFELSTTPAVVYTGTAYYGQTDVSWPVQQGMLVLVTVPIHSGVEYTTVLRWELRVIP